MRQGCAQETISPAPLLDLAFLFMNPLAATLGFDFGTESVRAVLVDLRGRELASAVAKYPHGQIVESLPGSAKKLPPHYALQHPLDWLDSAAKASCAALRQAQEKTHAIIGIGVGLSNCPMLP